MTLCCHMRLAVPGIDEAGTTLGVETSEAEKSKRYTRAWVTVSVQPWVRGVMMGWQLPHTAHDILGWSMIWSEWILLLYSCSITGSIAVSLTTVDSQMMKDIDEEHRVAETISIVNERYPYQISRMCMQARMLVHPVLRTVSIWYVRAHNPADESCDKQLSLSLM